MTKTPAWRRYLRFWRANIVEDVDDELDFHRDMRLAEYTARGMSEEEAQRMITTRLGDVEAARNECIELGEVRATHARQADFFDGLRADVRFALRSLRRAPGWTAVALLTIALGVGATTTVFSVVDALLVRPLPYPHASRVYVIKRQSMIGDHPVPAPIEISAVTEWRANARSIEAAMPYRITESQIGTGESAVPVRGAMIDTGFLSFAGARPLIGRNFAANELLPGGPPAVLLAEHFWRRYYGGSTDVIGRVEQFAATRRTIVGVVPASVTIPEFGAAAADVFVPLSPSPKLIVNGVIVRLKAGVSPAAATKELAAIYDRTQGNTPSMMPRHIAAELRLTRPEEQLRIRQALLLLAGAVALLLLVACTNVAHLLLARGMARQRELAVRHALGAGRSRLLRQLVTESLVLAAFGGALAVFVGWGGLKLMLALRPARLVELTHVSSDHSVLAISSALAIGCGLVIGLLAALRTAHRDLGISLRSGATSTLAGRRLHGSLVVGEVALSATLLVGALLLVHAVFDLQRTRLGFDVRDLYAVSFPLPPKSGVAERAAFMAELRARAATIPGVAAVTIGQNPPSPHYWRELVALETPEHPATGNAADADGIGSWAVAADYFSALGMPILTGRTFDEGSVARNEVIISTTLAKRLWPDGLAVGRRFRNSIATPGSLGAQWETVIGVVPDIVGDLLEGPAHPSYYRPIDGAPTDGFAASSVALIVRLRGTNQAAALKQFAAAVPTAGRPSAIVVNNIRADIDESLAEPRFTMRVLVGFATVGVLLAAIGLFGVISYGVGQRTREIGVRMTLGATRGSIARLVVGDGIRLALAGIALGLLGAVAGTRLIQSLLYGVSRFDPFSFGVGAALLLLISVVACVVPMLRATGVDPAIAVRVD